MNHFLFIQLADDAAPAPAAAVAVYSLVCWLYVCKSISVLSLVVNFIQDETFSPKLHLHLQIHQKRKNTHTHFKWQIVQNDSFIRQLCGLHSFRYFHPKFLQVHKIHQTLVKKLVSIISFLCIFNVIIIHSFRPSHR